MKIADQLLSQGNVFFKNRSYIPLLLLPFAFIATASSISKFPSWFGHAGINFPEMVAVVLCLIGFIIRMLTVGFTPANTSGRNTAMQVADSLNTTGIYSTVRHPLYLGNFFMWLAIAVLTADLYFVIVFCLCYFIFYERVMLAEEDFLANKFGDAYKQWSQQVPTIIPAFGKWHSPDLYFSWKKVLAKEKNGVLAFFTLVALFQLWVDYIQTGSVQLPHRWTLIALLITGLAYLVLKLIKYQTSWLKEENR
ncbi:MAG: isoprenylcysteine carboxylmethyltransferase family protein [Saprospiraceae bacterium]|nr:isoprenylcysteine carboxylmethyltransferase family protein [Saprospiraceae bacterium]